MIRALTARLQHLWLRAGYLGIYLSWGWAAAAERRLAKRHQSAQLEAQFYAEWRDELRAKLRSTGQTNTP